MREHKLILKEQEQESNYDFLNVPVYTTVGFKNVIGENYRDVVLEALLTIKNTYPNNADYFQVFEYKYNDSTIKFYCIHDEDHVTFLLPQEY